MDNKKFEDIMDEMLSGMKELSMDDLASVSGGVMTPEAEEKIRWGLKLAKSSDIGLDEVLQYVPKYYSIFSSAFPGVTVDDAVGYIQSNWDSI